MLVALLVGAITVAAIQWRRAHSLAHDQTQREAAARTASNLAAALFTYDYRNLAVTRQRLLALSTGEFAARQSADSAATEANLVKAHAVGTASVRQVTVSDVVADRAAALVVVNSHATATGGSTSSVNYLHMTLEMQRGAWKVDAVQTLDPPPG